MKKYISEMLGTMVLVLAGCGSAAISCSPNGLSTGIGFAGVAITFGLSVLIMVYAIGPISGCHLNPAVTFGMWISKKISGKDAIWYMVFQIIGAFLGAGILALMVGHADGLAVNSIDPYGLGYNTIQAVTAEFVLTFIFLLVIFGSTSEKAPTGFAGIAIGLTLTLIHMVSIPITNTSVNPARSIAPAILDSIGGGAGAGLSDLWIFILAPLAGAGLAALVWKYISGECTCNCKKK